MSVPVAASPWDWRVGSIAGIPVMLSPWILLMVAYVASQSTTWTQTFVAAAALLVSVFVHELGHAWEARRQKLKPSITLHGMGGYCAHQQARTADGAFRVTAAGPAAGFALAVVAFLVSVLLTTTPVLDAFLRQLWVLGAFWTFINLMPVQPLDGGALALNIARRFPSFKRADFWMGVLGVQVALLLAVGGTVLGLGLLSALALVFAYENAARLRWVRSLDELLTRVQDGRARSRVDGFVAGLILGLLHLGVRALASLAAPAGGTLALAWPDLHVWQGLTQQLALDGPTSFDLLVSLLAGQLFWQARERFGLGRVVLLVLLCSVLTLPVGAILATSRATGTGAAVTGTVLAVLVLLLAPGARKKFVEALLPAIVLLVALLAFRLVNPSPQRVFIDVAAAAGGLLFPVALLQWRSLQTWWKLRDPPAIDLH